MNENLKKQLGNLTEGAMTIPNLLSVIRIILIPVFLVLFPKGSYLAAVIVLGISGLTDTLDGKIARAFNQVSNLGKLLDPIADKLTQIILAIAYFFYFHASDDALLRYGSWLFWIFVLKEVLMLIGGIVLLTHDVTPRAAIIYGKVATVARVPQLVHPPVHCDRYPGRYSGCTHSGRVLRLCAGPAADQPEGRSFRKI